MEELKKRHVSLIKIAPLAQITLEEGKEECAICQDMQERRADVVSIIEDYKELAREMITYERELLARQEQLRAIRSDLTKFVRLNKKALLAHPMCPMCGVLIGTGHASKRLVCEPNGNALVCTQCYTWLDDAGVTFAEQKERDNDTDRGES
jgi:hypothetical protein